MKSTAGVTAEITPNDQNRRDCYEAFCDFEVEETGERGTGTAECSIMPVSPRWKA